MVKEAHSGTKRLDPAARLKLQHKIKKKPVFKQESTPQEAQQKWKQYKQRRQTVQQKKEQPAKEIDWQKRALQLKAEHEQLKLKGVVVPGYGRQFLNKDDRIVLKGAKSIEVSKIDQVKPTVVEQVPAELRGMLDSKEQLIAFLNRKRKYTKKNQPSKQHQQQQKQQRQQHPEQPPALQQQQGQSQESQAEQQGQPQRWRFVPRQLSG